MQNTHYSDQVSTQSLAHDSGVHPPQKQGSVLPLVRGSCFNVACNAAILVRLDTNACKKIFVVQEFFGKLPHLETESLLPALLNCDTVLISMNLTDQGLQPRCKARLSLFVFGRSGSIYLVCVQIAGMSADVGGRSQWPSSTAHVLCAFLTWILYQDIEKADKYISSAGVLEAISPTWVADASLVVQSNAMWVDPQWSFLQACELWQFCTRSSMANPHLTLCALAVAMLRRVSDGISDQLIIKERFSSVASLLEPANAHASR
ncbi:hypothetical protein MIR68_004701 [Amoeboaphelidium protococcarum]|nr:hypothetical protein MIR68_004701 [Amoeboaphelidium protococcarum]